MLPDPAHKVVVADLPLTDRVGARLSLLSLGEARAVVEVILGGHLVENSLAVKVIFCLFIRSSGHLCHTFQLMIVRLIRY